MEMRTRDVVVGSLLGDGWVEKPYSNTPTSSFIVKYNDKSLEYLKWIRVQLKELHPYELKSIPKYSQHYFYTERRKDLGELRRLFYPNEGKKRIPNNICQMLNNPMSLAIWYQDDGTLDRRTKNHWNALFATYCFPYEDCVKLTQAVKQNFQIEMSVTKCRMRGKMYYRLFVKTVRPYIHSNFTYKILG